MTTNTKTDQEIEKIGNELLGCVGTLAIGPVFLLWSGFVFQRLWLWFLEPLGAPEIGVLHAAGLMLMARLVAPHPNQDPAFLKWVGRSVVLPALALGIGWVLHHFMV